MGKLTEVEIIFIEAIHIPELRKKIISILEES